MLRPVGSPPPITPSPPHHIVETINEALVKTRPALAPAGSGARLGRAAKRALDIAVASTALCLLLPLLLFIALLIWGRDGHPPILRHRRLGRYGRPFACLKFRSVVPDGDPVPARPPATDAGAQARGAATHEPADDPRVTALGQVLRRTSLDELPLLWNVLRGEMSLVGPRPIVPADVARYGAAFPLCFSVPPGLTGLWQVSGRNVAGDAEGVALDCAYASRWSLAGDLGILIRTVPAVLSRRGGR